MSLKHFVHTILGVAAAATLLALAPPALAQTTGHPAPRTSGTHASESAPSAPSADGVVNIQTASADQLQLLPGIGPSKAEAIISYRTAHPFTRVEDLLRVRGIGRATFRRLRAMITVSGATTMTADVSTPRAHDAAAPTTGRSRDAHHD